MYRLDILDCNNDHFGKVKIVAKNENGESEKEVIFFVLNYFIFCKDVICEREALLATGYKMPLGAT